MSECVVCRADTNRAHMCGDCYRAYERDAHEAGDIIEVVRWAAKRARYFAAREATAKYALTAREENALRWLKDFVDDAMGASGEPEFLKRAMPVFKMLRRWIVKGSTR